MTDQIASHDPTHWREVFSTKPGDYCADTISVSDEGWIRLSAGGKVVSYMSVRGLVAAAWPTKPVAPPTPPALPALPALIERLKKMADESPYYFDTYTDMNAQTPTHTKFILAKDLQDVLVAEGERRPAPAPET